MATVFAYKGAWVQTNAYNAADVVEHESVNYVANKSVPASTEISNTEYWFKWVPSSDTSGLMSEVKQAKSTAEAAQSAASTASSTATEAKSTAEAAQSAASTASSTATEAKSTAEAAQSAASTASSTATEAKSTAEAAQSAITQEIEDRENGDLSLQTSVNYIIGYTSA